MNSEVRGHESGEKDHGAEGKTVQRTIINITPLVRQQEYEEKKAIQEKGTTAQSTTVTPSIESSIHSLKGGGQPLDQDTRAYFEPRFGYDFSGVRVHTDTKAGESAMTVNALAFTTGRDVFFGSGQYSPVTASGQRLLAHELTHVVQQSEGTLPLACTDSEDILKQDAEQAGRLAASERRFVSIVRATSANLARQEGTLPPPPDIEKPIPVFGWMPHEFPKYSEIQKLVEIIKNDSESTKRITAVSLGGWAGNALVMGPAILTGRGPSEEESKVICTGIQQATSNAIQAAKPSFVQTVVVGKEEKKEVGEATREGGYFTKAGIITGYHVATKVKFVSGQTIVFDWWATREPGDPLLYPSEEDFECKTRGMRFSQWPDSLKEAPTQSGQAVQRSVKTDVLQPKLKISQHDDIDEQEADRIAEQVMKMSDETVGSQQSAAGKGQGTIQRKPGIPLTNTSSNQEEDGKELMKGKLLLSQRVPSPQAKAEESHAKESDDNLQDITPNIESRINTLKGGGHSLPESVRSYFEPRFGHDFSKVRVHYDDKAAESAQAVNAKAFTVGRDVVFGTNQYIPETSSGKKLLAHELTHVVQQAGNAEISPILLRKNGERYLSTASGEIIKDAPGPVTDKSNSHFFLKIDTPPSGKYYYFRWSIRDANNNAYRMRSVDDDSEVWSYGHTKHVYINTPSLQAMFDKGAGSGCHILCRVLETDSSEIPGFYYPITESNTRVFSIDFNFKPGRQFVYPKIHETIFKELEYRVYFDQDAVLKAFQSAEPNEVAEIVRDLKLRPHLKHGNYYLLLLSEMKADCSDAQWSQFASIIGTPVVTGETPLQLSNEAKTLLSFLEKQIETPNVPDILKQMGAARSVDLDAALTTLRRRYDSTYGHGLNRLSATMREHGTPDQYLAYVKLLHESNLTEAIRETDPRIGLLVKQEAQLVQEGRPSALSDVEMTGLFVTRALEIAYTMLRNSEAQILRVLTRTSGVVEEQSKLDADVANTIKVLNRYFKPAIPEAPSFRDYASKVKSVLQSQGRNVTDEELRPIYNRQLQIQLYRLGAVRMQLLASQLKNVKLQIQQQREWLTTPKIVVQHPFYGPGPALQEVQRLREEAHSRSQELQQLEGKQQILQEIKKEIESVLPLLGGLEEEGLQRLSMLTGGAKEFDLILKGVLAGIFQNIEKARKYLHTGEVKVWLLPPVVAATRQAFGLPETPTNDTQRSWDRIINSAIKEAERDERKIRDILEIVNAGALILALGTALFTGGGSLALYAGIGAEATNIGISIYGTVEGYYAALAQEATYGAGLTEETRLSGIPPNWHVFYDALLSLGINAALAVVTLRSIYTMRSRLPRSASAGEIGREEINQIADHLGAQGVKVPREKILEALEQKLAKFQELEVKAAKAEQKYQEAVKNLLSTSGTLKMVIVPGAEEFAKVVKIAYYAVQKGIIAFEQFLIELKAQGLIEKIEDLSAEQKQVLLQAFEEGKGLAEAGASTLVGQYTTRIKWGVLEIDARPAGPGYWGKRVPQADVRVEAFERKVNPNNESFYLPSPRGGFVQFENLAGTTLQNGKLVQSLKSSFYRVEEMPPFAREKVLIEARRQVEAASPHGLNIEWLVNDERAITQLRNLFKEKSININVVPFAE
jgi:hypothetical protein